MLQTEVKITQLITDFARLDPAADGTVSVREFKAALSKHGGFLSSSPSIADSLATRFGVTRHSDLPLTEVDYVAFLAYLEDAVEEQKKKSTNSSSTTGGRGALRDSTNNNHHNHLNQNKFSTDKALEHASAKLLMKNSSNSSSTSGGEYDMNNNKVSFVDRALSNASRALLHQQQQKSSSSSSSRYQHQQQVDDHQNANTFRNSDEFRYIVNQLAVADATTMISSSSTTATNSAYTTKNNSPARASGNNNNNNNNSSMLALSPMTPTVDTTTTTTTNTTPSSANKEQQRQTHSPKQQNPTNQEEQQQRHVGRTIDFTSAMIHALSPPPKLSSTLKPTTTSAISYENATNAQIMMMNNNHHQQQEEEEVEKNHHHESTTTTMMSLSNIFSKIDTDKKGYVTFSDILYAFRLYDIKHAGRLEIEFLIEGVLGGKMTDNNNNRNNNNVVAVVAESAKLDLELFSIFLSRLKSETLEQLRDSRTWMISSSSSSARKNRQHRHVDPMPMQTTTTTVNDDATVGQGGMFSPGTVESPRHIQPPRPTQRNILVDDDDQSATTTSNNTTTTDDYDEESQQQQQQRQHEHHHANTRSSVSSSLQHHLHRTLESRRREEKMIKLKQQQKQQQQQQSKTKASSAAPVASFMKPTTSSSLRHHGSGVVNDDHEHQHQQHHLHHAEAHTKKPHQVQQKKQMVTSNTTNKPSSSTGSQEPVIPHYQRPTIQFRQRSTSVNSTTGNKHTNLETDHQPRTTKINLTSSSSFKRSPSLSAATQSRSSPSPRRTTTSTRPPSIENKNNNNNNKQPSPKSQHQDQQLIDDSILHLFRNKTHHITSLCLVVDVRRRGFVYLDKMIEILQTISPSCYSSDSHQIQLKKALSVAAKQKSGSWIVDYNEFVRVLDLQIAERKQQERRRNDLLVGASSASPSPRNIRNNNNSSPNRSGLTRLERLSQSRSPEIQLQQQQNVDECDESMTMKDFRAPTRTPDSNFTTEAQKTEDDNQPLSSSWKAAERHFMSVGSPRAAVASPSSQRRRDHHQQHHQPQPSNNQNQNHSHSRTQKENATETLRQMLKTELDRVSDHNPQIFIDYLISASESSRRYRNRDIWMVKVSQLEEALASLYAHKSRMQLQGDPSPSKSHNNVFVQPPEWVMTRARKIGQAPFATTTATPTSTSPSSLLFTGENITGKAKEIKRKTRDWMLANPELNVNEWIDASYLLETIYLM